MRIDTFYDFSIKFQHKPQNAVGGRMLRAEIDREITNICLGHG